MNAETRLRARSRGSYTAKNGDRLQNQDVFDILILPRGLTGVRLEGAIVLERLVIDTPSPALGGWAHVPRDPDMIVEPSRESMVTVLAESWEYLDGLA